MADLRSTIADVRQDGRERDIRCPAHEDGRASLSVGQGREGRILVKCHAGCSVEAILGAASLAMADLHERRNGDTFKIVAEYDYIDEDGKPYQVVRLAPKDFRQRQPDGNGGWTWNLKGIRRTLYRRAELQGQRVVYVVEGERDVHALVTLGIVATTNAGGAGKWREDYTRQLKAAGVTSVAILPDNDDPGRAHAAQVAQSCHAAGLAVKVVALPDLPAKGDVSDWLASGHTRDELVAIVKSTGLWQPPTTTETPPSATPTKTKPKSEKRQQGREVQFEEPEPWPESVNGAELLDAVAGTFTTYLALPQHASIALALWTMHAYAFEAWFATPFLAITSPEKRCGKTMLLIIVGALVPRRMFASNVTSAVLFRAIEKYKPTLLIDEADTFVRDNEELRGVLNSGHTKTTATVIRAVGDDHDPRSFSTWCAKAIALIGKLPGTLDDRSIEIRMRRKTAGEGVARLRQDRIETECASIRRQAIRWAEDHLERLKAADPDVPPALHDRAADCWRPLLAVADAAGEDWPTRAREAALALSGTTDEEAATTRLLRDIRAVFAEADDPEVMTSSSLIEKLIAIEEAPWPEWSRGKPITTAKLARMLAGYGIHSAGTIRIDATKTAKGYRRVAFVEAWERYLGGVEASQRNNTNENGAGSANSNRHNQQNEDGCDALKSEKNPIDTEHCYGVTDQDPPEKPAERKGAGYGRIVA